MKAKVFFLSVLAIQTALLGLAGLAIPGYDIPILRQVIGFIYLTFIPGLLILRILRLNRLGIIETLLYSMGLSIALVMFVGFFMNMFYPIFGITKPISAIPVIGTISVIVLVLCLIAYKREVPERKTPSHPVHWSKLLSPPVLLLPLLPLTAVLGTSLVSRNQTNAVSLTFLVLVALVVILVTFDKFIKAELYPLAVAAISLGLLWQYTLISPGLVGFDLHWHYWMQKLVLDRGVWDSSIALSINAMLSNVMLPPIYSLVLNLNTVWIFKIVYPAFFGLVPLALFQAYRKQVDNKVAFLGAFFFMSFVVFSQEAISTETQPIAEVFLALSILLLVSKQIPAVKRVALFIIFGISIAVSHYGVSYLYLLQLLMTVPLLRLLGSVRVRELLGRIVATFSMVSRRKDVVDPSQERTDEFRHGNMLTVGYVTLFIVFALTWYMYASGGVTFNTVVRMGDRIFSSLTASEVFSSTGREAVVLQTLGIAEKPTSFSYNYGQVIANAIRIFIIVGIIQVTVNVRKTKFYSEYLALSLASMAILALSIILPYFASSLNMSRVYHLMLLFLSPFGILGGITFLQWLFSALSSRFPKYLTSSILLKLVVVLVFVPYFLFQIGFLSYIKGNSISTILAPYETDQNFFTSPEIQARDWLGHVTGTVYSDAYGQVQLVEELGGRSALLPSDITVPQGSTIFLRRWNIVHKEMLLFRMEGVTPVVERINLESDPIVAEALSNRSVIYSNGSARVLK